MLILNESIQQVFNRPSHSRRDTQPRHHTIENDIRLISAEIYRIIRLPFFSEAKKNQILYLESLLAAYERDLKKYE